MGSPALGTTQLYVHSPTQPFWTQTSLFLGKALSGVLTAREAGGVGQHLPKGTHTHFMTLSTGPSIALDTACSSSLLALQNAYQAIRSGECPAAIVGGINLLLKPNTSVQFMKLGMLSPDGTCRSFDDSGKVGLGRDR